MTEIHCSTCGGFINDPARISFRLPPAVLDETFGAVPISAFCTCDPPVVFGPPAGRSSTPLMRSLN
jgi:hypothetical protein